MLGASLADGLIDQNLLRLLEGIVLGGMLLVVVIVALRSGRRSVALKCAGVLVLAYIVTGVGLHLMPRTTLMHHWLVGTPFQYAAVALAVGVLASQDLQGIRPRALRSVLLAGVGGLLLLRVVALVSLIGLLSAGRASVRWDPSLPDSACSQPSGRTAVYLSQRTGGSPARCTAWRTAAQD